MKLDIPGPERPVRPWTKAEDQLLGKLPDAELARRLHRTPVAISERRRQKRIPPMK